MDPSSADPGPLDYEDFPESSQVDEFGRSLPPPSRSPRSRSPSNSPDRRHRPARRRSISRSPRRDDSEERDRHRSRRDRDRDRGEPRDRERRDRPDYRGENGNRGRDYRGPRNDRDRFNNRRSSGYQRFPNDFQPAPQPELFSVWAAAHPEILPAARESEYSAYSREFKLAPERKFFTQFKNHEWFKDSYEPEILKNRFLQLKAAYPQRSAQFLADVKEFGISAIPELTANAEFHDFTVVVNTVPGRIPRSAVETAARECAGFREFFLGLPSSRHAFGRVGFLVFSNSSACQTAVEKLNSRKLVDNDSFELRVRPQLPSPPKFSTPGVAASAARITKDCELALQLARRLDSDRHIPEADNVDRVVEFLSESSERERLAALLYFLRRVHHFCYYCAAEASVEGTPGEFRTSEELFFKCGLSHGRGVWDEESSTASPSDVAWLARLDSAISARASTTPADFDALPAYLVSSPALPRLLDSHFARSIAWNSGLTEFRCRLCPKLFMSAPFVRKHIETKHPESLEPANNMAQAEWMFELYIQDPQHLTGDSDREKPRIAQAPLISMIPGNSGFPAQTIVATPGPIQRVGINERRPLRSYADVETPMDISRASPQSSGLLSHGAIQPQKLVALYGAGSGKWKAKPKVPQPEEKQAEPIESEAAVVVVDSIGEPLAEEFK